jgi:hypothetical protein
MASASESPTPRELPETAPWPRVMVASGNLGAFVGVLLLMNWLAEPLARIGVPLWTVILTALALLGVVDIVLDRVVLQPARQSPTIPGNSAGAERR